MTLVAQQLADLRQSGARPKKLRGEAVSKDMGPLVGVATNAGTLQGTLCNHRDRATGCKADIGGRRAEKQSATRRLGTAVAQVRNDSRADVWRDWHRRALPAIGTNEHLAGSPVDIINHEGRDLGGPHAELGEHHEDGVVPSPHRGRSIATVEDLLNLRGG